MADIRAVTSAMSRSVLEIRQRWTQSFPCVGPQFGCDQIFTSSARAAIRRERRSALSSSTTGATLHAAAIWLAQL
jgi:hypothetical protein